MVEQSAVALDRVFRALASAPRREILRRTAREKCTVTELAAHFEMSLAAVSKHIRVLDEAELLVETREGRLHWRRFNPTALEAAASSIEELRAFWTKQLDGLERFLLEPPTETDRAAVPKRRPKSRRRR